MPQEALSSHHQPWIVSHHLPAARRVPPAAEGTAVAEIAFPSFHIGVHRRRCPLGSAVLFFLPHRAYPHRFPSSSSPARPSSSGVIATLNWQSAWKVRNHGSARLGILLGSSRLTTR